MLPAPQGARKQTRDSGSLWTEREANGETGAPGTVHIIPTVPSSDSQSLMPTGSRSDPFAGIQYLL